MNQRMFLMKLITAVVLLHLVVVAHAADKPQTDEQRKAKMTPRTGRSLRTTSSSTRKVRNTPSWS